MQLCGPPACRRRQRLASIPSDITSTKTNVPGAAAAAAGGASVDFNLHTHRGENAGWVLRMNAALKHWKEAATLIVAAGHRIGTPPLSAAAASPAGSAHLTHRSDSDYEVLLLKRSSKSGFMPNAYVFPGGMVDSSDFSSDWLDVFESFSSSPNFGLRSVKQPVETRPPMFATDRLKLGSPIPGEVAFRICALRETFEESGVLLFVSKQEEKGVLKRSGHAGVVHHHNANELCSSELSRWRALVNQNPSNFVRMCKELEVLPNIWALHEWSNWLTPRGRYGAKRFDTAFFLCCLQDVPHTLQDEKEIVRVQVRSTAARRCQNQEQTRQRFRVKRF